MTVRVVQRHAGRLAAETVCRDPGRGGAKTPVELRSGVHGCGRTEGGQDRFDLDVNAMG